MAGPSLQHTNNDIRGTSGPSKKALTDEETAEIAFLEQLATQNPVSSSPWQQDEEEEKKGDKSMMKEEKRICNGEIYFITHVS